jgi:hypothetical protein
MAVRGSRTARVWSRVTGRRTRGSGERRWRRTSRRRPSEKPHVARRLEPGAVGQRHRGPLPLDDSRPELGQPGGVAARGRRVDDLARRPVASRASERVHIAHELTVTVGGEDAAHPDDLGSLREEAGVGRRARPAGRVGPQPASVSRRTAASV